MVYTAQKNPAALRSQELICKAMCALMGALPFAEITVTRICQEAGVGRKTFYRNFERKEDVVELMIDYLREEYEQELVQLHRYALGECVTAPPPGADRRTDGA